jgi:hypothetical protein
MLQIPLYENKSELHQYLRDNADMILAQKKATIKHALPFICNNNNVITETKKATNTNKVGSEIIRNLVLNSCNFLDKHLDVHINGLWKKSISEIKNKFILQEHDFSFNSLIAKGEDVRLFAQEMDWQTLGYQAIGKTEVLISETNIRRSVNPKMFEFYALNQVNQHSVGMQYVKYAMCINDPDFNEEYNNFLKYSKNVINTEKLVETTYFFAVTEAKFIEGSAVLLGSNEMTPTLLSDSEIKSESLNLEGEIKKQSLKENQRKFYLLTIKHL